MSDKAQPANEIARRAAEEIRTHFHKTLVTMKDPVAEIIQRVVVEPLTDSLHLAGATVLAYKSERDAQASRAAETELLLRNENALHGLTQDRLAIAEGRVRALEQEIAKLKLALTYERDEYEQYRADHPHVVEAP